ncbi:uncharacterized protein HKW66_Vig0246150 [Vigna angularis]|uniref:Uncharacterized protein n=1 Tax=Phaseolus angularis TaxID=3914 RepID=A0A8T0KCK4_PHAAN|nr:uncharacterized protein HKW66_Vig0246150 [Vigna angularis]
MAMKTSEVLVESLVKMKNSVKMLEVMMMRVANLSRGEETKRKRRGDTVSKETQLDASRKGEESLLEELDMEGVKKRSTMLAKAKKRSAIIKNKLAKSLERSVKVKDNMTNVKKMKNPTLNGRNKPDVG